MATENEQSQAANNSAPLNFDTKIVTWTQDFLRPLAALVNNLQKVRILKDVNSPDIANIKWPTDRVYVPMDAILSMYNAYLEAKALPPEYFVRFNQMMDEAKQHGEEAMMERLIYDPSLLCTIMPWDKERVIFHVKPQEFSTDFLEQPTAIFAKLPTWSMCFSLEDHQFDWDGRRVIGIFFARYMINTPPQMPNNEQLPQSEALEGETPALINNLISTVIFDDGSFELGPFLSLNQNMTLKEFFASVESNMMENLNAVGVAQDKERAQKMITETMQRTTNVLSLLHYALTHLDALKDAQGNPAKVPAHPQATLTNNNQASVQYATTTTNLYLD